MSDLKQDKPEYHFTIWPDNKAMAETLETTFQQHWKN
jgi:hypothetical protein